MRARAWLTLLALALACGKQGPPLRHPPQPRGSTPAAQAPAESPAPAMPAVEEATPPAPETEVMQP